VFVDIERATFNLDVEQVATQVTAKTRAIVPVHLFGQCADMEPLLQLSSSTGIPLIEDACQSIGATYAGRSAGTMGAFGCFSFFPSKNLGAFGDGGMVTAATADLGRKIRLLRSHGAETKYFHDEVGGNFRLDEIQAAILRVKLRSLDDWTRARQRNAHRYRLLFAEHGLSDVVLPEEAPGRTHIYNQFVIRVPNRDAVKAHLLAAHVGCEIYYPRPFHLQRCFAHLGYRAGAFPESEKAAADSLALPIYAELTEGQQQEVVAAVGAALRQ
jgi:dTDP-4-amino-4,6-dideoxygalactose transaminase